MDRVFLIPYILDYGIVVDGKRIKHVSIDVDNTDPDFVVIDEETGTRYPYKDNGKTWSVYIEPFFK